MTSDRIFEILNQVKTKSPLIHAITNPISITQCANTALAVGARPVMAEHPKEVGEITKTADAVLLNTGNITDVRMRSMLISGKTAKKHHIPVVIDLVGISCSSLRRKYALKLIRKTCPTLIKGNYSEVFSLFDKHYKSRGVDSDKALTETEMRDIITSLSHKYNAIILASGKTDIICYKADMFRIKNGTPALAKITGTGCMLGMLCACFLAVSPDIYGGITACLTLGICGENTDFQGNGSFFINLMDALSGKIPLEVSKIEKI
jgi:hydroxyethylthiazole kinase